MKKKNIINNLLLFIPIFILISISLYNMYKVGIHFSIYKNYFFKQSLWFIIGFIILFTIKFIKPKHLFKYSKLFYWINIILLILVLFIGKTINGSKAWFDLGFISFQPSELMKFTLALYLSNTLSNIPNSNLKTQFKFILNALFLTLIPSLFVFLEPDTGAIIIYLLIMLGVILVYKINYKWYIFFFILLLIIIIVFGYIFYFNKDIFIKIFGTSFFYRIDRILTFINNDSFQLDRALISIGSSRFLPNSKYVYIPEAPTDFIIALTISNIGLIGFFITLLCFLLLDIYFLSLFFKTKNKQYKMFLSSFLLMFIFAQIQNIGMNIGLFPIIGLPLPFLSYGGTNIIVYFMFLGVIIHKNKHFD
ncbi:MAG: hypothetical protein E7163_01745 [Firmicutes bacterium]|nr:hypothetical protein [Bacillota bacterium]